MHADTATGLDDATVSLKRGGFLALKLDHRLSDRRAEDIVIVLTDGLQTLGIDDYVAPDSIAEDVYRALFIKAEKSGSIEVNWSITASQGQPGKVKKNVINVEVA